MKNVFNPLFKRLEETKKQLHETKELNTKKLERFYESLQKDFQNAITAAEEKRNLIKEALLQKSQLKKFKQGIFSMVFTTRIRWLLSAPFIYSMIIPIIIFHVFLELYHQITFRLCHIPLVSYKDHFIFDRRHLSYLNVLEKLNCMYCGYYNGLMSYAREIGGRTERYWCPIKHARRVFDEHSQYKDFYEYLDAEGYREERKKLRKTGKLPYSTKKPPA